MCFKRKKIEFIDKLDQPKKDKFSWLKESTETSRLIGKIVLFIIICSLLGGFITFIVFLVQYYGS
ncbi:MAG: hypothetical protein ACFFDS_09795 [Candidatus Thorarchaeota archaeon]